MSPTAKSEVRQVVWLCIAVAIAGVLYTGIAKDQHEQAIADAAEQREQLRQLVVSESKQLNFVLGNFIAKSKTAAYVEADIVGNVTYLNERAEGELAVKVGQPIETCMRPAAAEGHQQRYQTAMFAHSKKRPATASRVGLVKAPDGTWHKCRVESWTTLDGSRAFITRLE